MTIKFIATGEYDKRNSPVTPFIEFIQQRMRAYGFTDVKVEIGTAPAEPEAPRVGWSIVNRERGRLIDKKVAGTITEGEAAVLAVLQSYADRHIDQVAPRPQWRDKIFDHKHLDPTCVESGCQSLFLAEADAKLATAREALAYAYQLAGATGEPVEHLDNLSAILRGEKPPHEWKAAGQAHLALEFQLAAERAACVRAVEMVAADPKQHGLIHGAIAKPLSQLAEQLTAANERVATQQPKSHTDSLALHQQMTERRRKKQAQLQPNSGVLDPTRSNSEDGQEQTAKKESI